MDRNLALLLIFAICIAVPAWVFATCGKFSINALARNPSASPRIFITMIIVMVFAQALAIIAMLVAFQLFG